MFGKMCAYSVMMTCFLLVSLWLCVQLSCSGCCLVYFYCRVAGLMTTSVLSEL